MGDHELLAPYSKEKIVFEETKLYFAFTGKNGSEYLLRLSFWCSMAMVANPPTFSMASVKLSYL